MRSKYIDCTESERESKKCVFKQKRLEHFLLVGSDLNSFSLFVSFRGCLRVISFFVLIYKGAFIAYRIFVKTGNQISYIIRNLGLHKNY